MNLFLFDGLALVMVALVAIVALVITSFSRRYMDGDKNQKSFFQTLGALSCVSFVLVLSNHIALFISAWALMGILLARLIGHVRNWEQARCASKIALRHFIFGTLCLLVALAWLGIESGYWTITSILENLAHINALTLWGSGSLIALSAIVQSALIPFHKWLLASMTAPTPVSAFMHAGLVNAGGFLIVRFAPLYSVLPELLLAFFIVGAFTALIASYWMLAQNDIKRMLGCSTSAQMGFMVLQCGLGFYSAAIAHLVLHGFYKAYHFLAAGSSIGASAPSEQQTRNIFPNTKHFVSRWPIMLAGGVSAALVFAQMTGKTIYLNNIFMNDGGSVLVIFVALAGFQAASSLAALRHLSYLSRLSGTVILSVLAAALYSVLFNMLSTLIPVDAVQPLTYTHLAVVMIFATFWLAMHAGVHRKSARAYMAALNGAQPPSSTILADRRHYHA